MYQVYVQLKRFEISDFLKASFYRVINIGRSTDLESSQLKTASRNLSPDGLGRLSQAIDAAEGSDMGADGNLDGESPLMVSSSGGTASLSSLSSSQSHSYTFNKTIKDFKKALGERNTPKNLLYLNRLLILFFLAVLCISAIYF